MLYCLRDGDQKPADCGSFMEVRSGELIGASGAAGIVLN